ncbi:dihydroneopterin aldolase [Candidatus Peregrinibacteria bacterium]|jgi:7,8-dihydroneopterin aldolase/epimerase/oxygenase|nr:dihydroneopterin aldolase [Candidatus Peregrinibacteria bacterium]MBT5468381.1 dihydroneopterin aldolase [Candidatus Peregrinibacteria bacterium]MBT7337777.1 dihydroneopterin aldolase [Candidatus Peregrinibacteria bacterium]
MDTILIQDLKVSTHIGITEEERADKQELKVSVWIRTDIQAIAKSDDINDAIDYAEVALKIQELGETERKTLERFVEDIAQMILDTFCTEDVSVSVDKFALPDAERVAITINRP